MNNKIEVIPFHGDFDFQEHQEWIIMEIAKLMMLPKHWPRPVDKHQNEDSSHDGNAQITSTAGR